MKSIFWEYQKAFDSTRVKLAMANQKDACRLVVQSIGYSREKPCEDMSEYLAIDDWNCYPVYSKTVPIDESFLLSAFEIITKSLVGMYEAEHDDGMDGDNLTIKMCGDEGHKCEIYIWTPEFEKDDRYATNDVYALFLQVLERAGLLEWYNN